MVEIGTSVDGGIHRKILFLLLGVIVLFESLNCENTTYKSASLPLYFVILVTDTGNQNMRIGLLVLIILNK